MEINRQSVEEIMTAIMKAIKPIAKKNDVTITHTGGTYDEAEANCRLTIISLPGREKKRAGDFLAVCGAYGIKKDAIGKTFNYQKEKFIFLGIDTTKKKIPVIAKTAKTNIEYQLPETDQIKKQLNK